MGNFKYNNNNNSNNKNGCPKPTSHYTKKHFSHDDPMLSALHLERKFCMTVGRVPWKKIVEHQRYAYLDKKVLEWKDSAVEEAFWDAKKRFYAKVQGRPCDAQMLDPDMFIDNIDWNSSVDPKLYLELEKLKLGGSCVTEKQEGGVIIGLPVTTTPGTIGWGDAEGVKPPLEVSGWGDIEEVKPPPEVSGWGDIEEVKPPPQVSGWGDIEEVKPPPEVSGWGDDVGSAHWGVYVDKTDGWGGDDDVGNARWGNNVVKREVSGWNVYVPQKMIRDGENRINGSTWNGYAKRNEPRRNHNFNEGYNRKGDRGGWSSPRQKVPRAQPNNNNHSNNYYWRPATRRE